MAMEIRNVGMVPDELPIQPQSHEVSLTTPHADILRMNTIVVKITQDMIAKSEERHKGRVGKLAAAAHMALMGATSIFLGSENC